MIRFTELQTALAPLFTLQPIPETVVVEPRKDAQCR